MFRRSFLQQEKRLPCALEKEGKGGLSASQRVVDEVAVEKCPGLGHGAVGKGGMVQKERKAKRRGGSE